MDLSISKFKTTFKNTELKKILLFLLILLSIFLRFYKLGYSNFYGDETKTLYWNKTIPAREFLFDQRKGPVQFVVVWIMETLSGGFDEFVIRFPFALAGLLSVIVMYLVVKRLFDWRAGLISAFLFSTNGFFIAFSRTAQYQSFLWLFGFLSILFMVQGVVLFESYKQNVLDLKNTAPMIDRILKSRYWKGSKFWKKLNGQKISMLLFSLSGINLALALLSHYDAIFFAIPVLWIFVEFLFKNFNIKFARNTKNRISILEINPDPSTNPNSSLKPNYEPDIKLPVKFLISFIVPLILFVGLFYIPYFTEGYFLKNVPGYISRRINHEDSFSNSIKTFYVYNRFILSGIIFLIAPLYALLKEGRNKSPVVMLFFWFLTPFIVLELVFSNPGTHVQQYIIPLIILTAAGIVWLYDVSSEYRVQDLFGIFLGVLGTCFIVYSVLTFIPIKSIKYPWNKEILGKDESSLFLYGFPYNRGWSQTGEYLKSVGAKTFYTTDNVTVAEYYLLGIPADNYEPEYFIDVSENQVFKQPTTYFKERVLGNYTYVLDKEIEVGNRKVAEIYKKSEIRIPGQKYLLK